VSSEAGSNQARGALGPLRPDRCAPTHSGAMRPNATATARLGPCGKRTGMHPRTRSSEAIRGHQRRSPWRSPVEEDGDAPKDEVIRGNQRSSEALATALACGRGRGCTQERGHQRQSEVIRGARHGARLWKRTGMHPRTRSSEAIRGHQRRSPWRSPVEEDGDAPKDEGVDYGLSRDGVTCGERGGRAP
jgi:hypothetical protein